MTEKNINTLFDRAINDKKLKNDAALSRLLHVTPPVISKMRHHKLAPTCMIILALHELADIPMADIRKVLPRKPFVATAGAADRE